MRNKIYPLLTVALATVSLFFAGCEDDMSNIGGSISSSEVTINVDSLTYSLNARMIGAPALESRSIYSLVGSLRIPEYGALDCSYVTQFLPAESLNIPDTINYTDIDSVKMVLSIPKSYVTGDTLAPLQLKVYSLTKNLPADITPSFDPTGYYNPAEPLGVQNYTLSGYTFNDSTYTSSKAVQIMAKLPLEIGRETVKAYRETPEIFLWPGEFAEKYWHGVYVEPSFGKGCLAPVHNTSVYAYYPVSVATTIKDEEGNNVNAYKTVADSVCLYSSAPEVLSSVNIAYTPSANIEKLKEEGKSIMTTPGGYAVAITFPAADILKEYWKEEYDLGVINNIVFSIPAKGVSNSYGLGIPPALLMVKTSELEDFFSEGRLPDNKSSFTSILNTDSNLYTFSSMRQYIVDLKEKGEANITPEDVDFTLVPVTVSTEDYTDMSTGNLVTTVTSISPYIIMPTMVELDTDNAIIVFTYSNQTL